MARIAKGPWLKHCARGTPSKLRCLVVFVPQHSFILEAMADQRFLQVYSLIELTVTCQSRCESRFATAKSRSAKALRLKCEKHDAEARLVAHWNQVVADVELNVALRKAFLMNHTLTGPVTATFNDFDSAEFWWRAYMRAKDEELPRSQTKARLAKEKFARSKMELHKFRLKRTSKLSSLLNCKKRLQHHRVSLMKLLAGHPETRSSVAHGPPVILGTAVIPGTGPNVGNGAAHHADDVWQEVSTNTLSALHEAKVQFNLP